MSNITQQQIDQLRTQFERGIEATKESIDLLKRIDDHGFLSYVKPKGIDSRQYITVNDDGIVLIGQGLIEKISKECIHNRPNGLGAYMEMRDGTTRTVITISVRAWKQHEINTRRLRIEESKSFLSRTS